MCAPEVRSTFADTIRIFRERLPEFFEADAETEHVKHTIQTHGRSASRYIDYDRFAPAFNRAFFFKNYFKALTALWNARHLLPYNVPIIDVGAGAGVFSLAWHTLFSHSSNGFLLIDRSSKQLQWASRVAHAFDMPNPTLRVGVYPEEFSDLAGLRLFSYWFCEQIPVAGGSVPERSRNWMGEQNLIIDYGDVLRDVERQLPSNLVSESNSIKTVPPEGYADLFNDTSFKVCWLHVRSPLLRDT